MGERVEMSLLPDRVEESKNNNNNVENSTYYVKLEAFEGPFDLLYHLLTKEKIDIWEVPLAYITEQYLKYLRGMHELQIAPAGEFLVMAASLLRLKSRLLLPQKSAGIDEKEEEAFYFGSKEELVNSLLEYKRFKELSFFLKQREEQQQKIFLRSWGPQKVFIVTRQSTLFAYPLDTLELAIQNLKKKKSAKKSYRAIPAPEEFSLRQTFRRIMGLIKKITTLNFSFRDCLEKGNRSDVVQTFAALLELARRGKISLRQEKLFGEIYISGKIRRNQKKKQTVDHNKNILERSGSRAFRNESQL